jgi:hypothetical protein
LNKKEVDNDLQKLDKRTKRKINALTTEAVLKIRPVSVFDTDPKAVDKMVKEAFDSINYDKRLTDIITGASVEGANLALQNIGTVSVDKYIDYELAKTYDGVKLSSLIRSSAKDAEKSVSAVVKQNLKEGTNWKKLSKDIQQVDKVGDIAGAVSDLAAQAKRLGVDVTAQKKEVLQYVKRLSPNGAPNQQLKNAYMGVIKAVESKDTVIIDKALEKAVKAKITYNAERISRTEIATGYGQAFMQRIELDEDATGFKWLLSARHPVTDECDFYATLDNGAGKGVYKKGDFPSLPAHPNCLCSLVPYYEDAPAKTTAENARRHLNNMPESKRAKVIGKESSEYKSRYIDGLKKHGIDLNDKPVRLPVEIINILPKG